MRQGIWLLVIGSLGAFLPAAVAAPPLFTARIDIATIADQVVCLATGDLNASGRIDAVSGSVSDRTLRWYENLGGDPPEFIIHDIQVNVDANDGSPRHIAIADVNGDGRPDLVTAWSVMHKVRWYENDGQSPPTFIAHDVSMHSSQIHSLTVADFTGDGRNDIATSDSSRILLHSRLGEDDTWSSIEIASSGSLSLFAADIDGDGRVDLATGTVAGSVVWLRNLGGSPPAFEPRTVFHDIGPGRAVHVADINGDGHLDIISASETQHVVRLHLSDGADPPNWSTQTVFEGAQGVKAVWAADLTKNGRLDIISGARTDHTLRWHENQGGEPPDFQTHVVSRDTQWVEAVLAADIDGDGCLDIVSASARDDSVRWHRNDLERPGRVAFVKRVVDTGVVFARDAIAADLTGNGTPDIVSTTTSIASVRWHENLGGEEPQFIRRSLVEGGSTRYFAWPADINADGRMDLLIGSFATPHVWWLQNFAGSPPSFAWRVIGSDDTYSPGAADLNGDGLMDAFTVGFAGLRWHQNIGFIPPSLTTRHVVFESQLNGAAAVDLNLDGQMDIVSAGIGGVRWHRNDGGSPPQFDTEVLMSDGSPYDNIIAVDLTRNGFADLVCVGRQVVWLEHQGDDPPTFMPHVMVRSAPGGVRFNSAHVADLNGNGRPDIMIGSDGGDSVRWLENIGGSPPRFVQHVVFTDAARSSVFPADINSDGATDILVSHQGPASAQGSVLWFENIGDVMRSPDLNGDGVVGPSDLAILLGAWGLCPPSPAPCRADLTRDSVVNASDLAILLGAWGGD